MKNKNTVLLLTVLFVSMLARYSYAQSSTVGANYISTAVPFLTISPDSRTGAMGEAGVATSVDANSMFVNPAKYAFAESKMGVSLTYTPWLRNIVKDMNLSFLSGYYKLDDKQTLAASLRYFTLGDIIFRKNQVETPITRKPNEFSIDIAYSRKLSEYLSGGTAFRYIRSDLTQGQDVGGLATQAGNAFAVDVSVYYRKPFTSNRKDYVWSWGVNISNIGSKIAYTKEDEKEFIPTNLRLGSALEYKLDDYNSITFAIDMNKLLVPTPDNGKLDIGGTPTVGSELSDKSVMSGIFSSFGDAPGGFKEEINEIAWSLGAEYLYRKQFAVRAGYFYENENKGNRKYFTAGLGLKLNMFDVDMSYLIPTTQNNPLQNTLRFSLSANLDDLL